MSGLVMGVLFSGRLGLSVGMFLALGAGVFLGGGTRLGLRRWAAHRRIRSVTHAAGAVRMIAAGPVFQPMAALAAPGGIAGDGLLKMNAVTPVLADGVLRAEVSEDLFRAISEVSPRLGSLTRAVYGQGPRAPLGVSEMDIVLLAYVRGLVTGSGLAAGGGDVPNLSDSVLKRCIPRRRVTAATAAWARPQATEIVAALEVVEALGWNDGAAVQLRRASEAGFGSAKRSSPWAMRSDGRDFPSHGAA